MSKDVSLPPGRVLVVGLGNPGQKYDRTRHNIGFDVVRELARRYGVGLSDKKFKGVFGHGDVAGRTLCALLPQTFMNLSGEAVQPCLGFYKLTTASLIVAHDDIDLVTGKVRLKVGGGHGGHNGLRSLDKLLPNKDYLRVRLGVGRPPEPNANVANWVLGHFGSDEARLVEHLVDTGADAIERLMRDGLLDAQGEIHPRQPPAAS
ncbi:MAG: PTH1 family peptidyl-tRNA hydrolase [Bradymonadia bacterium]|jgi:PTH1 family peptidyl-tRNA hydrolase